MSILPERYEMTHPSNAAVEYLHGLYIAAPEEYPEDSELQQALENSDWKKVVSRLVDIRDSESAHERLGHFRQMMSHIEASCVAEKILKQATLAYTQAKAEQELLASL